MTNLRHPTDWRDALTQAVSYLGKPEVAKLVEKSEDILDKLTNPNVEGYLLPVQRAMKVDAALVAQGFPAVFSYLFAEAVKQATPTPRDGAPQPVAESDHELVARITTGAAKVLDGFLDADKDKQLSQVEKKGLLKATGDLQQRLAAFRRRIFK